MFIINKLLTSVRTFFSGLRYQRVLINSDKIKPQKLLKCKYFILVLKKNSCLDLTLKKCYKNC